MSINVQRNYEKENWTFFAKHIYIYIILIIILLKFLLLFTFWNCQYFNA